MEKKIYDEIRFFNKNASESTIKMYVLNVMTVCKGLGYNIDECKPSIFKNTKAVFDLIEKQSMNTQKNKLVAILVYLQSRGYDKDVIELYNNRIYMLLGKLRNQTDKNEWNDKEKDKLISMEELTLLIVTLKKQLPSVINNYSDLNKYMRYIIVALSINYPLRNDWAEMKMVSKEEFKNNKDYNFMVIDKEEGNIKCYVNKYKTVKSHGSIEFECNDKEIVDIIAKYYKNVKEYYDEKNKIFDHWLLFKRDFEPMSRNLYTKFLQEIFYSETGKKISSSMLRKIITSSLIDIKKFKEMAKLQGHSINVAMSSYVKS